VYRPQLDCQYQENPNRSLQAECTVPVATLPEVCQPQSAHLSIFLHLRIPQNATVVNCILRYENEGRVIENEPPHVNSTLSKLSSNTKQPYIYICLKQQLYTKFRDWLSIPELIMFPAGIFHALWRLCIHRQQADGLLYLLQF